MIHARPGAEQGARMEVVVPVPRRDWSEILDASDQALAFQRPEWLDALCRTSGFTDAARLYVRPGRRIVVPLARRAGLRGIGGAVASLPYGWGFGGAVADGPLEATDVAEIAADLAAQPWIRLAVRPEPRVAEPWAAAFGPGAIRVPRRAHLLDLEGGFDAVWEHRFTSDCRRHVRCAERAGLTVERGRGPADLDAFAGLYECSVERWSRLAGPAPVGWLMRVRAERRAKFDAAAAALGGGLTIWVAREGARPVAAIIVLSQGTTASYWRGAMDEEPAGRTRANYLLHRLAIEDASRAGMRTYHMGDTGASASLAQFKTRFGAAPVDYAEVRLERLPFTASADVLRSAAGALLRARRVGAARPRARGVRPVAAAGTAGAADAAHRPNT